MVSSGFMPSVPDDALWIMPRLKENRDLKAHLAWQNVRHYLFMAGKQMERIQESCDLADRVWDIPFPSYPSMADGADPQDIHREIESLRTAKHFSYQQALMDVHFYLNCWRIIALNCFRIMELIEDEGMNELCACQQCAATGFDRARNCVTLGWYAHGRDHFEHLDERIMGGRNFKKLKSHDDPALVQKSGVAFLSGPDGTFVFPSFDGHTLRIGDEHWDVSPDSLNALTQIVDDFRAVARERANDMYSGRRVAHQMDAPRRDDTN